MDLANQLIAFLGSSVSANRKHDRDIKVRNLLDAYSKFVLGFLRKFGLKIFRFPFPTPRGRKYIVSVHVHYLYKKSLFQINRGGGVKINLLI